VTDLKTQSHEIDKYRGRVRMINSIHAKNSFTVHQTITNKFDQKIEQLSGYLDRLVRQEVGAASNVNDSINEQINNSVNKFKGSEQLGNIKIALLNLTNKISNPGFDLAVKLDDHEVQESKNELLKELKQDLRTFGLDDKKLESIIKNINNGFELDTLSNLISLKELGITDLSERDFSNRNLNHWSVFDFSGVDFAKAKFHEAELKNLRLDRINFSGADLQKANLQGTSLKKADLTNANLEGANLSISDETKMIFNTKGNISGYVQNDLLQGVILDAANLTGATFAGTDMETASLKEVNATGTNFSGTNLSEASLSGNFTRADFSGAFLIQADFKPANDYQAIIFNKTDLRQAVLDNEFEKYLKNLPNKTVYLESLEKRPPEVKEKIETLREKVEAGMYKASSSPEPLLAFIKDTFELFPGLALGENHADIKYRHEMIRLMPELKKIGLDCIAIELSHDRFQKHVDNFMNASSDEEDKYLKILSEGLSKLQYMDKSGQQDDRRDSLLNLIKSAKENEVKFLCVDSTSSLKSLDNDGNTINKIYTENQAEWCGPIRQRESEPFIVEKIESKLRESGANHPKYLMLFGWGHASPDARRTDPETEKAYSRLGIPTAAIQSGSQESSITAINEEPRRGLHMNDVYKTLDFNIFI
jgi:uncharacterized protein YjbI with pentapeptide repeats